MMTPTQRVVAEIPQVLQEALQDYLNQHPDWDQNRVFAAALSLFLLQNGDGDRRASQVYLESLFRPASVGEPEKSTELVTSSAEKADLEEGGLEIEVEPAPSPVITEGMQDSETAIAPEPTPTAAPAPTSAA